MTQSKKKQVKQPLPIPLFDTLVTIRKIKFPLNIKLQYAENYFDAARTFLKEYDGNQATYNSYRREIERLLQWSWLIQKIERISMNHTIQDSRYTVGQVNTQLLRLLFEFLQRFLISLKMF